MEMEDVELFDLGDHLIQLDGFPDAGVSLVAGLAKRFGNAALKLRTRVGIATGEQHDLMAPPYQLLCKIVDNSFSAPIATGRNAFPKR